MGYTTEFEGELRLDRPLTEAQAAYLEKFFDCRHMARRMSSEFGVEGEFFVEGHKYFGEVDIAENTIIDHNRPPKTQPGLWCNYEVTEDRQGLRWNGSEKSYHMEEWAAYIVKTFLIPEGYVLNGSMMAQGEERSDVWMLVVENNVVKVKQGITYKIFLDENDIRKALPEPKKVIGYSAV